MFNFGGKTLRLMKVGLVRAACPPELQSTYENKSADYPIVIMKNVKRVGTVQATSYTPNAIIIAGAAVRNDLLDIGNVTSWCFVEQGAIEKPGEMMGAGELLMRIAHALGQKIYGPLRMLNASASVPTINAVYPFENYFLYAYNGSRFKQSYSLDPVERRVALRGSSSLIQACPDDRMRADSGMQTPGMHMPMVQTGVRHAVAPVMPHSASYTRGAANSELVTMVVRSFADVNEAVNSYLNYTRARDNRQPMRPRFQPVALGTDNKILRALAARGIDTLDFVAWAAAVQQQAIDAGTKTISDGTKVPHSQFAYVGNKADPSTWKLPISDAVHARASLTCVGKTKGIPASEKAKVLLKVRRAIKATNVGGSALSTL